ncbi:MAG: AsmA family protein [Alphaproteobacteria bacterium]|nr:AsmA family protein [Alphaproteobacteria bacterium]
MKRLLIALPTILVLLLAAVFVGPSFIDWNKYKPEITEQVKKATGYNMALEGDLAFSLLPWPRLSIEKTSISVPVEGTPSSPFASFDRLDISVALMPLLSQELQVKTVTIVKPEINLTVLANGKLNALSPEIEAMTAGKEKKDANNAIPSVSLDKIKIKDGTFTYADSKSKSQVKLENINADISATSLFGPYTIDGSIIFEDRIFNISAQAEKFIPQSKTLAVNIKTTVKPGNIEFNYAGALNFADGVSLQGPVSILVESLPKALEAFGIANPGISDIPLSTKGIVSADKNGVRIGGLEVSPGPNKLQGAMQATFAPQTFQILLKSPSKMDLSAIYPAASYAKNVTFELTASGDANKITLSNTTLDLDGNKLKISGDYILKTKSGRSLLALNIDTDKIDYDAIAEKLSKSSQSQPQDIESSLKNIQIPLDVDMNFSSETLRYQKQDIKGLNAKISLRENSANIQNLSIKSYMGSNISVTGGIENMRALQGITVNADLDASDIKALLKGNGIDTASLPAALDKVKAKTKWSGSATQMDVTANISAMDGEIIAQGAVKTPLSQPSVMNVTVQVKHPDLEKALTALSGTSIKSENLSGPLDLYAKVSQIGQSYKLEDISGKLAGSTVTGTALADLSQTKPYIKSDLDFGKLSLKTIVSDTSSAGSSQGSERWSREPINTQGLQAINADISISAKSLNYGPWPMQEPKMKLQLKDGTLDISQLEAGIFDGRISVNAKISAAPQERQPLHIEGNSKLENVAIGPLVKALSGTQLIKASGIVSMDTQVSTSGNSPAALVYDLSGQGTVTGNNIVLEGVDITRFARALSEESKPGDTALGLWKGSTKGGSTSFDTLDGNYAITEGIINIAKLDLDGPGASIATTGNINLPQWTLATKHHITVKNRDDVPPFDVSFNGSIDNPGQTFGQGLLQDYLSRKVNRKVQSILSKKLGLPTEEGQDATDPQNVEPADGAQQDSGTSELLQQNSSQQDQQDAVPSEKEQVNEFKKKAIEGLIKGLMQ